MGYRSEVKIYMGEKAYNLLKARCEGHEEEYVRDMVLNPDVRVFYPTKQAVLIGWDWIKWYSGYADIDTVENALAELDELFEEDANYFYKKVELGEDGAVTESTNDSYCEYTEGLYSDASIVVPELKTADPDVDLTCPHCGCDIKEDSPAVQSYALFDNGSWQMDEPHATCVKCSKKLNSDQVSYLMKQLRFN